MSEKKEPRLTNFQVPLSPQAKVYDALKKLPEIDLNGQKYQDVGKIHHGDLQDAIDRTIDKKAAERGVAIDQTEAPQEYNLNGVQDERPKQYWKPPRIGNR